MRSIQVRDAPAGSWGNAVGIAPSMAAFVDRIARRAADDPAGYRRRVLLAGVLGYAALGGLLLVAVALVAAVLGLILYAPQAIGIELKVAFLVGMVVVAIVRAMWVPAEPLDGVEIRLEEAPALWSLVAEVRFATHGSKVDAIRIVDRMNAAIVQTTAWFFLRRRNVLFIGAPLMQAVEVDELRAIVAHEMGHFVGAHGHSAGFVYRVRQRWLQLADRLPTGTFAWLLRRFFAWYGPWFASYSFVLARQQEYEADAVAAKAVGADIAARALLRVTCQHARHERVWRAVWSLAPLRPDPPSSPTAMSGSAAEGADEEDQAAIERELAMEAGLDDTHPGLAERLCALGISPYVPPPLVDSAFDLLGASKRAIADALDRTWYETCEASWADAYRARLDMLAECEALVAAAEGGEIDPDARFRLAELIEEIDGPLAGADAFATAADYAQDPTAARSRRGLALLQAGDDRGITLADDAAARLPSVAGRLYLAIAVHLEATNRPEEAVAYREKAIEADQRAEQARAEASTIDETVVLQPLSADLRALVQARVLEVAGIAQLDVALRPLPTSATDQIICLVRPQRSNDAQEVVDALVARLVESHDVLCIQASHSRRWLAKRLARVEGSRLIG